MISIITNFPVANVREPRLGAMDATEIGTSALFPRGSHVATIGAVSETRARRYTCVVGAFSFTDLEDFCLLFFLFLSNDNEMPSFARLSRHARRRVPTE